jgi:hypothetical protein
MVGRDQEKIKPNRPRLGKFERSRAPFKDDVQIGVVDFFFETR